MTLSGTLSSILLHELPQSGTLRKPFVLTTMGEKEQSSNESLRREVVCLRKRLEWGQPHVCCLSGIDALVETH